MMTKIYKQIGQLTDLEIEAARAYAASSGLFHLWAQTDLSMVLGDFKPFAELVSGQTIADLFKATSSKYEIISPTILYSGHGNGVGAVGALGHSDATKFKGLRWQYRGFTSTSLQKERAENFVYTRAKHTNDTPVFLEFHLKTGFRLLPMECLGADSSHEAEFLLPPRAGFDIVAASHSTIAGVTNVLHLVLET